MVSVLSCYVLFHSAQQPLLNGILGEFLVTGISRHAEGANHAGSQGYASPVTELQPGRGAPKSIRRWKPSPETYPASDGVAQ